jgi:hypothetical protein
MQNVSSAPTRESEQHARILSAASCRRAVQRAVAGPDQVVWRGGVNVGQPVADGKVARHRHRERSACEQLTSIGCFLRQAHESTVCRLDERPRWPAAIDRRLERMKDCHHSVWCHAKETAAAELAPP